MTTFKCKHTIQNSPEEQTCAFMVFHHFIAMLGVFLRRMLSNCEEFVPPLVEAVTQGDVNNTEPDSGSWKTPPRNMSVLLWNVAELVALFS